MNEAKGIAYSEGFLAFENDLKDSDCPYNEGCQARIDWVNGYQQAEEEHTERVTCNLLGIPM
ncbi:hypothetical protein A3709_19640 [Halioglobus sp. HI00S01]|uniref:Rmf/CrpP family protein n=1 Tax=Halioglobus sp. HI00S01 TaxID=1822214 RepID=UPI0007C2294F|nr:Rmf/CrpP family protein [Halioglobus sp. HI00S01]KZX57839.1 hypothetical protein A3709_19640 [Halioglobus sp. HI00S01]